MDILLTIHSWLRWPIVLVAILAIVKFIVGWLGNRIYERMDHGLMTGFRGLLDLQVTLGIIYLLWSGFSGTGFPLYRLAHGLIMIIAAGVAHMSMRWKTVGDATRFRNNLFLVAGSLILILIGISILPRGLSR